MPKLIDFSNFKNERNKKESYDLPNVEEVKQNYNSEENVKAMVIILQNQKPNKLLFSLKEAADVLGIGEEFLRRRIKTGKINAVRLGDKPAINLVELARILSEGV